MSAQLLGCRVACTPEAGEDLAPDRVVPVAEGAPAGDRVAAERAASEDLGGGAEEDGGVLGVGEHREARVWREVAGGPLPHVPDELVYAERGGALGVGADRRGAQMPLAEVGVLGCGVRIAPGIAPGAPALRVPAGRLLPLCLAARPLAGPGGIGLGLVEAHVGHRLVLPHGLDDPEPTAQPAGA